MPVVADDSPAHAAVVVLVLNGHASARELRFARDDDVVIMVFPMFHVDDLPARCGLTFEAAVCVHAYPSLPTDLGLPRRRHAERRNEYGIRAAAEIVTAA